MVLYKLQCQVKIIFSHGDKSNQVACIATTASVIRGRFLSGSFDNKEKNYSIVHSMFLFFLLYFAKL